MKALRRNLLAAAALSAAMIFSILGWGARPSAAADDPAVSAADRDFVQAAAKSDTAALGKLLDADFVWIDAKGNVESRAQVLQSVPKPGTNDAKDAEMQRHAYGQVEAVQANSGKIHVLRIWVKRPAGWRTLVYQEVESLGAPPKTTPSAGKDCQNPCKSVGYTPKNQTEQAIITAYEGLETSAIAQDAAGWDAHTGEEFVAASSFSDRLLDKPTRMAELQRKNMAGLAPTPLVSGKLFVFGDAAVLRSRHEAGAAKLEVTRVFVKRNSKWVETASYQTAVQGGAS